MSIYSPQHKAIYLSPNRLDLLHRRRGLGNQQDGCMVSAIQTCKASLLVRADVRLSQGLCFRVPWFQCPQQLLERRLVLCRCWHINHLESVRA
jgi:hypothetical protein